MYLAAKTSCQKSSVFSQPLMQKHHLCLSFLLLFLLKNKKKKQVKMAPNFQNSILTSTDNSWNPSSEINFRQKLIQSEPILIPYVRPDRRMNRIFAYDDESEDKFDKMIRENPELAGFAVPEENPKEHDILSSNDVNEEETISKATDGSNLEPTIETAFDAHLLQTSGRLPCPTEPCKILKVAEVAHSFVNIVKNKIKTKFVNIHLS